MRSNRPSPAVRTAVRLLRIRRATGKASGTEPVLSHISELGSCRYFVAEDAIAVVSPDEEKVVAVIDRS